MRAAMRGWASVILICITAQSLSAAVIWVAPTGDDGASGTSAAPFASLARAVRGARPGDTIQLRGGLYRDQRAIRLNASGAPNAPITIQAAPGEHPVLDFTGEKGVALHIRGAWWHIDGLTLRNAGDCGIRVTGGGAHHNTLERLNVSGCGNTGINASGGAHDNLLLNCDSHANYDPENHGQNADGFGLKFDIGTGNRLIGCRAWNNSDDGYDCWHAGSAVRFERCYAWGNGVDRWNDAAFEGNGNGFKLGQLEGAHVLVRCAAWDQPQGGFDLNGNSTGVTVEQCTAVRCRLPFRFTFTKGNADKNVLRNNLALGGSVKIDRRIDAAHNSWNTQGVKITEADFASLDATPLEGTRKPDGSLPGGPFLRLTPGSDAIDAGVDLGRPYAGKAPDLGAFEYESAPTTDTTDTKGA